MDSGSKGIEQKQGSFADHGFSALESHATSDPLVKNMIEIGHMIARNEESHREQPLERWRNAYIDGFNFFKGAVFLSSNNGSIPNIAIQRHGVEYKGNFVHAGRLGSYWGCLIYYSDGYLVTNFTKGALLEGVTFPSADEFLMEKYAKRGAIIRADDFVTSVFRIDDLEKGTLNYLRNFSKEALKAFKQPFRMS